MVTYGVNYGTERHPARRWRKRRDHRVLFVGRNERTKRQLDKLLDDPSFSVSVVGFLDDDSQLGTDRLPSLDAIPHLGRVGEIEQVLRASAVDEVYVTLPIKSCYDQIQRTLATCEVAGVPVSLSTDLFGTTIARAEKTPRETGKIVYSCVPYPRWKLAIKRTVDVLGATVGLVLLALPMLFIALLIKLTSRGPVLFEQRRCGRNHHTFGMLKFRTMVPGAEKMKAALEHLNEVDGPAFKVKNDPRVTPLGRFLRKYSLDELPQLLNVLRGDMSLVGPRPPIPTEVEKYEWWQRRRLSMRPGLTCLWQVSGRNGIGFGEWMLLDLAYIDNWSLRLDLSLLLRTIPAVLRGRGAS
ncbi:MAG: sugar transferase [Planctomycetota bacterium]